jgi:S1-C subfamily serine protease
MNKKSTKEWLGGTLKNIETPEEQSAFGLHSIDGIIVLKVEDQSELAKSGMIDGDVIVGIEGEEVMNLTFEILHPNNVIFY